jgi:hypothetical protein
MDELAQRFFEWLAKFTLVSAALVIGVHLAARRLRAREQASALPPATGASRPKN